MFPALFFLRDCCCDICITANEKGRLLRPTRCLHSALSVRVYCTDVRGVTMRGFMHSSTYLPPMLGSLENWRCCCACIFLLPFFHRRRFKNYTRYILVTPGKIPLRGNVFEKPKSFLTTRFYPGYIPPPGGKTKGFHHEVSQLCVKNRPFLGCFRPVLRRPMRYSLGVAFQNNDTPAPGIS